MIAGSAFGQEYTPDTNTVALWHFDELHSDTVNDASSNGNNGTAIGTTVVSGKFMQTRSFNGISDRVTVPSSVDLNVSPFLTLEAWIKPTGFSAGPNTFLRKNGPNSQNGYLMHFKNNGTAFDFGINTKFGLGTDTPVDPSYFLDGRWHHVAGTYDGSIARVYFDGVLMDQDAFNETIGTNSTDPVSIGANDIYGEYFQGLIDEIRISNKVRQPNEFNLQLPPKNITIDAVGNTIILNWENGGGIAPLLHYNVYRGDDSANMVLIDSISSETYRDSGLSLDHLYYYRISGVDISEYEGHTSYSVSKEILITNSNGEYSSDINTVALWHFSELHGDTINDASGYVNNGTATGTNIVSGKFGNARSFLNSGDGVVANNNLIGSGNGSYTLEAWILPSSYSDINNRRMIFNQRSSGNGTPTVEVYLGNVGELVFLIRNDASNIFTLSNSILPPIVQLNVWTHIGVVNDSANSRLRLYINGFQVANGILGNWGTLSDLNVFAVGRNAYNTSNDWFNGSIDEVRVSNKAREAYEFDLQLPPKNLSAVGSGRTVNLTWQNGGGAVGLLTYKIYRGVDSLNVALIDSTTLTSYSDSSVISGATYFYRIAALDLTNFEGAKSFAANAMTIFTGVKADLNLPKEYKLGQNFPNPFNPSTIIRYDLPKATFVHVAVCDVLGREVATLVDEMEQAGSRTVEFKAEFLPSGVYFYRLQAGSFAETKKLLIIK